MGLAAAVAVAAGAGIARADGAFPDELQVFLPGDHPSRILLATNFGLVESEDDGVSWTFVCEAQAGAAGNLGLYQMGPTDTLMSEYYGGVVRSGDLGCSWDNAGGSVAPDAGLWVWDGAFDPLAPGHVLVLGQYGASGSAVYPSTDDAVTFGAPVYSTPSSLTGIELSQSAPGVAYATGNELVSQTPDGGTPRYGFGAPFVLPGGDGGFSWGTPIDHPEIASELGTDAGVKIGLAEVDPKDPQTVYLRLTVEPTGPDYLAVTHDAGKTVQILFKSPEAMSAFLVASDGTLYVGTRNGTGAGGLFSAPPGGGTPSFARVDQSCPDGGSCDLHLRCLGERAGTIYACGDNWVDGFALGRSTDHGKTFQGLLQFVDIGGLSSCNGTDIQAVCGATWGALAQLFGIDAGMPGVAPDAGSAAPTPRGCGCSASGGGGLLALLGLVALGRRRRWR